MQALPGGRNGGSARTAGPDSMSRLGFEICFVGLALLFTLIALGTNAPAMDTGDWIRAFESMGVHVGSWIQAGNCLRYNLSALEPPTSSFAHFGYIYTQLDRALGGTCLSLDHWMLVLSAIYWLGALQALRRAEGWPRWLAAFWHCALYFLFSGYLHSFYQEALFLALTPWILVFAGRQPFALLPYIGFVAAVLFIKSQIVFIVPVFFALVVWHHTQSPSYLRTGLALLVIAFASWHSIAQNSCCAEQNDYNRVFHGIGWSLMDAETWPGRSFNVRQHYFLDNQEALAAPFGSICAPEGLSLMGTTYWHVGYGLHMSLKAGTAPPGTEAFLDDLGFRAFFSCLLKHDTPLSFLKTVFSIYLNSEYTISYAINYSADNGFAGMVNATRDLVLRHLSQLLVAATSVLILFSRRRLPVIVALYTLLATPVFVVAGDGFFEFEKHIVVNFIFLIGFVLPFLSTSRARGLSVPR